MEESELSVGDWAVLGVVAEGPTHGFAVAQRLAADGDLGQIWALPKPVVYQTLKKLHGLELVAPIGVQPSQTGPRRTVFSATPAGRSQLKKWLQQPVEHVRDVRSLLLLKLALLDRAGRSSDRLVERQRRRLHRQVGALEGARSETEGFDRVLLEWRISGSRATLDFLDRLDGIQ